MLLENIKGVPLERIPFCDLSSENSILFVLNDIKDADYIYNLLIKFLLRRIDFFHRRKAVFPKLQRAGSLGLGAAVWPSIQVGKRVDFFGSAYRGLLHIRRCFFGKARGA